MRVWGAVAVVRSAGMVTFANGATYEGQYKADEKHGEVTSKSFEPSLYLKKSISSLDLDDSKHKSNQTPRRGYHDLCQWCCCIRG